MGWIANLIGAGIIERITGPLLEAQRMRLDAETDAERLELDRQIASMKVTRDIAVAELRERWSATRIGRNLIVIPYGIWWTSIFAVQIINPWIAEPLFGATLIVYDVPPQINEMAKWLIPAIVVGDALPRLNQRSPK